MFFAELFTAALLAIILVMAFTFVLGRGGTWPGVGWFFVIVFLGAWAVGAWSTPVGPVFYGVSWLPFLFGALAFALILAAISDADRRPRPTTGEVMEAEALAVGSFFWLLLLLLAIAIVAGAVA